MEIGWDRFETRHKCKDGRIIEIEASVNYAADGKFFAFMRDITKRKQMEVKLTQSEEKYRTMIEHSNDMIWTLDMQGNFIYFNKKAEELTDYELADWRGKSFAPLIPVEDLPRLQKIFVNTLAGKSQKYEVSINKNDGSTLIISVNSAPIYESGTVVGSVSFGRDITELKQSEGKLRESEERHCRLVDLFPYGIAITIEGKIVYINHAGAKIHGASSPSEIIGKSLLELIPPEYQKYANERFSKVEDGKAAPAMEEKLLRLDGTEVDVEMGAIPFIYKGKEAIYAVFQDITIRKNAEALHLENLRLEHESKTKSEFLAAMSHELRTPLNAITGFSDIMSLGIGGSLNETYKGHVKDIHNAGEHLLLIIDDILDLSKVEAGKMELVIEKFSVHELLESTFTLIKIKAIKHNINIIRDIDSQLEFMEGDKQKIKQVLFNLLSNAVKFSKENGGTITVAVKKIGGMVRFSVSDTGIGIEKKNLNKLFKEFQQLDSGITRKYGGTGLGLVISKKLVELHGGKMTVESIYGEGSTFAFALPVQLKQNDQDKGSA